MLIWTNFNILAITISNISSLLQKLDFQIEVVQTQKGLLQFLQNFVI